MRIAALTLALLLGLMNHAQRGAIAEEKDVPQQDGFTSLFDGKTLDGWHLMNGAKFAAEDGVIKLNGGRGWLRSDKEYDDFIIKLDVRWMKKKQDSGVFLRASKEGGNWPNKKYEVQCENSERIAKVFGAQHQRDVALATKTLKGDPGEWNTYEITCTGPKLEVKLNGTVVATSDALKTPSGYIGFQGESGQLEFRNISIKPLK